MSIWRFIAQKYIHWQKKCPSSDVILCVVFQVDIISQEFCSYYIKKTKILAQSTICETQFYFLIIYWRKEGNTIKFGWNDLQITFQGEIQFLFHQISMNEWMNAWLHVQFSMSLFIITRKEYFYNIKYSNLT